MGVRIPERGRHPGSPATTIVEIQDRRRGHIAPLLLHPNPAIQNETKPATQIKTWQPIELDYMCALAAYVGPSPRRVKRLVNAYRLLKSRLSDAQLGSFVTDRNTDEGGLRSGPYQLAIGLLVIGTGAPTSASQILKELAQRNPADGLDKVIESFRERQQPDWTMAAQVLETLMRTQKAKDVAELRGWARKVGRFLLRGPAEV